MRLVTKGDELMDYISCWQVHPDRLFLPRLTLYYRDWAFDRFGRRGSVLPPSRSLWP